MGMEATHYTIIGYDLTPFMTDWKIVNGRKVYCDIK